MSDLVANSDVFTMSSDDNVFYGNVLDNDVGDNLFFRFLDGERVGGPKGVWSVEGEYGTFYVAPDGKLNYKLDHTNPAVMALEEGETLQEVLSYKISDGEGNTDFDYVTMNIVGAANNTPVAVHDFYTMDEHDDVLTGNLLDNDYDPDGDPIVVSFISNDPTPLTYVPNEGGTVTIDTDYGTFTIGRNGEFTYDLDETNPAVIALGEGETLTESLFYKIYDGNANNSSDYDQVTITINGENDRPTAVTDFISMSALDVDATGNLLTNDFDPENDPLQVSFISAEPTPLDYIPNDGSTVTVVGDYGTFEVGRDGNFTYDLDETNADVLDIIANGGSLTDEFFYKIWDGGSTNSADYDMAIVTIDSPAVL